MKLGVLDVGGEVDHTVELAGLADTLGYERYWIAEHQPQPTPILLASIVAGITPRIRVGTAGILFHYYTPWRTAHDFHFLERAYEGRIDAGFCAGAAPTTPPEELEGRDLAKRIEDYPDKVARLVRHLRNTPGDPAYDPSTAWHGALDDPPQIWSLGGGPRSAELAARHGLYLGYSLLYASSADDPASAKRYREQFVPARTQPAPHVVLAVCVACAPTSAGAQRLASTLPQDFFKPRVVGDPESCADQLRALADRYEVDEIVIADRVGHIDARKQCYQLLAEQLIPSSG